MKNSAAPQPIGLPVSLNDFPKHSPWPTQLLNAQERVAHPKNRSNVLREFNDEKWKSLLNLLQQGSDPPDLHRLQQLIAPSDEERLYSVRGDLFRAPAASVQMEYLNYLVDALQGLGPTDRIGELGGGAGNLLLYLAKNTGLAKRWISYELTQNGRHITDLVAKSEVLDVSTCFIDFNQSFPSSTESANTRAVYFSSFALAYCHDPYPFISTLLDQRPSAILLIEPIYQFFDASTLLGLLAKRYFDYNNYSSKLWPAIERLVATNRIEISRLDKNTFGHNPLCPVSALSLMPCA